MNKCERIPPCPRICMCHIVDRIVNQNLDTQVRGQEDSFTPKQIKQLKYVIEEHLTRCGIENIWIDGFRKGFKEGYKDGIVEGNHDA